jgi:hypothetical protein
VTHLLEEKVGRMLRVVRLYERLVQPLGDEHQTGAHKSERGECTNMNWERRVVPSEPRSYETCAERDREHPGPAIE